MIAVNLIPLARLRAGQRKRRIQGWSVLSAVLGFAIGVAAAGVHIATTATAPDIRPSMAATQERIDNANAASERLRADLAKVRAPLNANETAGKHPDWSVVLNLLAGTRGDKVVLVACELMPAKEPAQAAPPARGAPKAPAKVNQKRWTHALVVEGFAYSTLEAQEYCLRLESSNVFDAVTPPETFAGEYEGRPATRFRFECRFAPREGDSR